MERRGWRGESHRLLGLVVLSSTWMRAWRPCRFLRDADALRFGVAPPSVAVLAPPSVAVPLPLPLSDR